VNAVGLFTTTASKKLLNKILHMHIDFQEFCSFCLLMRWCTKKQKLDGSNLQDSKLIPESIRKIMTLDLKDPTGIKYQIW
jgi:hypothetical protein